MHYKAPDNSLHFLGNDSFFHLLPIGSVQITEEEAEALRPAPAMFNPIAQIQALEQEQLLPRATREFMLLAMEAQFTPEQLEANPGYQAVKVFDNNIVNLRAQVP